MLAVRLREHHQFHVRRVAAGLGEGGVQVVDFVFRHGQAQLDVRRFQRALALPQQVDRFERTRFQRAEQVLGVVGAAQHGFRHAVVQQVGHGLYLLVRQFAGADGAAQDARFQVDAESDAAFDALDVRHAAVVRDVGGFRSPRRNRAETGDDEEFFGSAFRIVGLGRLAVRQQGAKTGAVIGREGRAGIDEMDIACLYGNNRRRDGLQLA